jgi:hypothetical protein
MYPAQHQAHTRLLLLCRLKEQLHLCIQASCALAAGAPTSVLATTSRLRKSFSNSARRDW